MYEVHIIYVDGGIEIPADDQTKTKAGPYLEYCPCAYRAHTPLSH